jgi:hypothetical protein
MHGKKFSDAEEKLMQDPDFLGDRIVRTSKKDARG